MGKSPLSIAIKDVVNKDGMPQAYGDRLKALIENFMRANIDDSDIEVLLEMIEIADSPDED